MSSQEKHWITDNHENRIHSTALIGARVEIGHNNHIGPFTVIGGMGCPVILGNHNFIGAHCVLGSLPENARELPGSAMRFIQHSDSSTGADKMFPGLVVGSRVVVRDLVTVHGGMHRSTHLSDLVYIHSRCHLDHDSVAEVGTVLAPGVTTGGRVSFGAFSQVGLESSLHQDSRIGAFSMIGMNSTVKGTIKPFSLHFGSPSRYRGINLIRLKRLGLGASEIQEIEDLVRPDSELSNQFRLDSIIEDLVVKSTAESLGIWESWK